MADFKRRVIEKDAVQLEVGKALTNNANNLRYFGIACDKLVEPVPNYIQAPCEKVIQGENNTFIVMGRDRPNNLVSGYGGKGHTKAGTIDIVAGRTSADVQTQTANGSEIVPLYVHNNFIQDASRVYISQKTDIDENLRIDKPLTQNTSGKAAIALKSDNIRLVARETMKLVTGTDLKNSLGARIISIPGIELIAGNDSTTLQPIPKGENLIELVQSLLKHINDLNAIIDQFLTYQLEFNSVLMQHTHPNPLAMFFGTLSSGNPLEITNGRDLPSPEVFQSGIKTNTSLLMQTKKDLILNKQNITNCELNYLRPFGEKFINSRYNKVN